MLKIFRKTVNFVNGHSFISFLEIIFFSLSYSTAFSQLLKTFLRLPPICGTAFPVFFYADEMHEEETNGLLKLREIRSSLL